jgi:uncharacterized protein
MSLEMRQACENCQTSLGSAATAYICSHECTYCHDCAFRLQYSCKNCGGELVRRPRRGTDGARSDCDPVVVASAGRDGLG